MNCPNCGLLLPDDSSFCQYCGTVLPGNVPENEPAHAAHPSVQPDAASPAVMPSPAAVPSPTTAPFPAAVPSSIAAPSPAAAPATQNPGSATRQKHKRKKTKQCKACGADIDPRTQKCTACGKPASRVQPAVLALAAVSVLLVCSLVGNLVQYGSSTRVQQELEQQLEQQWESSNATIAAQESAILELEEKLEETEAERQRSEAMLLYTKAELKDAQEDSYNFDLIRSFLTKSDAGYASDQFYASKSVLILSMTGGDQTFSLITGFSGHGQYSCSTTSNSVLVSFTEDTWYGGRTTIRVSPKSTGSAYITFSNNLNSQTFRVLVIVT